jgi:hypothetical protein
MPIRMLIAALTMSAALVSAATNLPPQRGVEVQMILTSADHMNHHPAALKSTDITIMDATITDWLPLTGRDLELFFLIDDSANYDPGPKLQELRRFIAIQPDPVAIGVAYIHDGTLSIAENPTIDHQRAARALRAPSGGRSDNTYGALADLIVKWPRKTVRREVIMVSAGMAAPANADGALHDAERAGVVVYALYNPTGDYLSEDWSKVDDGLVNLASLSYETGGEAYFIGHTPPLSVEPFLADISEHLAHQYLVKFQVPCTPNGAFQTIFITPGNPDWELMKPERVWVPGPVR